MNMLRQKCVSGSWVRKLLVKMELMRNGSSVLHYFFNSKKCYGNWNTFSTLFKIIGILAANICVNLHWNRRLFPKTLDIETIRFNYYALCRNPPINDKKGIRCSKLLPLFHLKRRPVLVVSFFVGSNSLLPIFFILNFIYKVF